MPVARRLVRALAPLRTHTSSPRRAAAAWAAALLLAGAMGCKKEGDGAPATAEPTASPAAEAGATPGQLPAGDPGMPGAAPQGPPFDPQSMPAVVARIDGVEITREDVVERAGLMRAQMAQMGAPPPPADEGFYREMLNQLVGAHLLYAEAKRQNLAPSAEEVQARVAQLKARFPSEEEFRKHLAAQGGSEEQVAFELGRSIAVQRITEKITGGIAPAEQELRDFYQENLDRMRRPPQVRTRHILVLVPEGATAEQRQAARAEADQILQQVRGGGDFAALARQHSDDPASAQRGGELPWLARGEAVPPFEEAAFALQPGQVSEVVESPFGYHVIRMEEQRPAATVPFEEARPQIAQLLERRKGTEAVRARVQELRQQAKVELLF